MVPSLLLLGTCMCYSNIPSYSDLRVVVCEMHNRDFDQNNVPTISGHHELPPKICVTEPCAPLKLRRSHLAPNESEPGTAA